MDNESFDKRIQESLLGFQDQTPASVGWNKLKLPAAGGIGGIKKWLWISGITNVILLAVVPYFYHEYQKLNHRVVQLEQQRELAAIKAEAPTYILLTDTICEYVEAPSVGFATKKYASAAPKQSTGFTIPEYWLAIKSYEVSNKIAPEEAYLIGADDQVNIGEFHSGITTSKTTKVGTKKPVSKSISMATIAELERNKFGKSVKWEYGLGLNGGKNLAAVESDSKGAGPGAFVNLWINPFFSIQSGINANFQFKSTQDSTAIHSSWNTYLTNPIPDSKVAELETRTTGLEIPLILRYHVPISQKAQFSFGAGALTQFNRSTHQRFTILVPEKEHHEYPEMEFDSFKKDFETKNWEYLNTSLYAELAYRRRIGISRIFWSTGMYYKQPLINSQPVVPNQLGGFLRFSFSQH